MDLLESAFPERTKLLVLHLGWFIYTHIKNIDFRKVHLNTKLEAGKRTILP